MANLKFLFFSIYFFTIRCIGYEENLHLYGIISGFFNSSSALGAFIGPSLSGYLGDKLGFPWSMTINGAIIFSLVS